MKKIYPNPI